tara:strand:+ start:181 stop:1029 length:849 start_codon:yes stop_codon:yes gene_type:complete
MFELRSEIDIQKDAHRYAQSQLISEFPDIVVFEPPNNVSISARVRSESFLKLSGDQVQQCIKTKMLPGNMFITDSNKVPNQQIDLYVNALSEGSATLKETKIKLDDAQNITTTQDDKLIARMMYDVYVIPGLEERRNHSDEQLLSLIRAHENGFNSFIDNSNISFVAVLYSNVYLLQGIGGGTFSQMFYLYLAQLRFVIHLSKTKTVLYSPIFPTPDSPRIFYCAVRWFGNTLIKCINRLFVDCSKIYDNDGIKMFINPDLTPTDLSEKFSNYSRPRTQYLV